MGITILVVDDDASMRRFLEWTLSLEGYEVVGAGHGGNALDVLTLRRPDLIVLDLMMPVMDGEEFLSVCRERDLCRDVPVIIMSAGRSQAQAKRLGAFTFFRKPFDPGDLCLAVKAALSA